ncbi:DUF1244 domain-containing protein [Endozoicomonas numazuensis]|uniref:Deoxycytidine triphosphate deaminase n=1 Tax=Endozoicomonas numazuensis TaxID=1137799 RepID=A0A081NGP7_9GAMM|nr:DUF1244 domain-containing protein [Endozoicomonas numazuensis]KEQ17620.1 deoxycytidine triphosphate deaminase [Endozoicomonas numazuensis]
MTTQIDQETRDKLDAATFRRLLKHLDDNKDVQNIDLMILANFCRNCLGKWYKTAADDLGVEVSDNEARERVYGMPYSQWKENHQQPATPEQLAAFEAKQNK